MAKCHLCEQQSDKEFPASLEIIYLAFPLGCFWYLCDSCVDKIREFMDTLEPPAKEDE